MDMVPSHSLWSFLHNCATCLILAFGKGLFHQISLQIPSFSNHIFRSLFSPLSIWLLSLQARDIEDFAAFEGEVGDEGGDAPAPSSSGLPWDGTDRDYTYEETLSTSCPLRSSAAYALGMTGSCFSLSPCLCSCLELLGPLLLSGRVFGILRENNPELTGERRRTIMKPPQVRHPDPRRPMPICNCFVGAAKLSFCCFFFLLAKNSMSVLSIPQVKARELHPQPLGTVMPRLLFLLVSWD